MTPSPTAPSPPIRYHYRILTPDDEKSFVVEIDPDTLALVQPPRQSYPEWTRLDFHQCPNCPLDPARHPRCPVAASLVDLVDGFRNSNSYDPVTVVVEGAARTYSKTTSMQTAVSSLLGLFMVTAGCPVLDPLRPMVDTHMPFLTRRETLYRILSMHLLAQYFLHKDGQAVDWSLGGLFDQLEQIRQVNVAFCKRLNSIPIKDASVNALVILTTLGDFPSRRITQQDVDRLEHIFRATRRPAEEG